MARRIPLYDPNKPEQTRTELVIDDAGWVSIRVIDPKFDAGNEHLAVTFNAEFSTFVQNMLATGDRKIGRVLIHFLQELASLLAGCSIILTGYTNLVLLQTDLEDLHDYVQVANCGFMDALAKFKELAKKKNSS